jgi:hypothetical protein
MGRSETPPVLRDVAGPSPGRKILSILLIGSGLSLAVSGVVNAVAAWQLIASAEEKSLGITRGEILGWAALLFAAGLLLAGFGFWLRVSRPRRESPQRT